MSETPLDLKYTKTHEWVKVEGDTVTVGITAHAQQLLGDMVFVELPEVGDEINMGEELGVVESVKAASDFYAPISGIVTQVNEVLSDSPEIINSSPYDDGWIVKLKSFDEGYLNELLSAEQYAELIAEES
jgi:glycine cleavage system H protein